MVPPLDAGSDVRPYPALHHRWISRWYPSAFYPAWAVLQLLFSPSQNQRLSHQHSNYWCHWCSPAKLLTTRFGWLPRFLGEPSTNSAKGFIDNLTSHWSQKTGQVGIMFGALNRFISVLDRSPEDSRNSNAGANGAFGFQVLRNNNQELRLEPWFDFIIGINGRTLVRCFKLLKMYINGMTG